MKKACFIAAILITITMFLGGCGSQLRKSTIDAHKLAVKTQQTVVYDMYTIGVKAFVADANAKLAAGADYKEVTKEFAKRFDKFRWLVVQHEKANGLHGIVQVYVESRKTWLEQAYEDLKNIIKKE